MNKHIYRRENPVVDTKRVLALKSHGMSHSEIAESMGISKSSVNRVLHPEEAQRHNARRRRTQTQPA